MNNFFIDRFISWLIVFYDISTFVGFSDGTITSATPPGQGEPVSKGNKGVVHIAQKTGASPSDVFVSYLGHSLGGSYPSAKVHSVYSIAPANWAHR